MSSPERQAAPATGALTIRAEELAKEILDAVAKGDCAAVDPQAVQALIGAVCRVYAAQQESGSLFPALARQDAATGTEVMIMCSALLKAADLQVFELGMWSSWTGR